VATQSLGWPVGASASSRLNEQLSDEFSDNERKEVSVMHKKYEAPELTVIGEANEVVMGLGIGGDDFPQQLAIDFEFERD
jgi:hypothetical protein